MPKPKGFRSPGFAANRARLLAAVQTKLLAEGPGVSMGEMAKEAGVSLPTMRHYFGSRGGAVAAAMAGWGEAGAPFLLLSATRPDEAGLRSSVEGFLRFLWFGLTAAGVGRIHLVGLRESGRERGAASGYLDHILEPTLRAIEARLAAHQAAGEMRAADVRTAALALASPVVLAALHQTELGGAERRPLEPDAFFSELTEAFLRAYGTV